MTKIAFYKKFGKQLYIYVLLKQSRNLYQCEEKIKVKTLCPCFPNVQNSTGKLRTVYISSNWIKIVFIIEETYEEHKIGIVQSLVKSI